MALSAGPVARAALAGAAAATAFGTVEIWFTELSVWAFHRASFAPLEPGFAVALFALYPLAGAAAGALCAAAARALGWAGQDRAVRALALLSVLLAHAAFRVPAFAGGSRLLLAGVNALLVVAALATAARGGPASLAVFTGPWTAALLLCAPVWLMTDVLAEASRPARALAFLAAAGALAAAALGLARPGSRRAGAPLSILAAVATLATVCVAGPDSPVQRSASARAGGGPNVVLVVLDTVRADHLSLYGYPRDTSPGLRRFAETSTVYARAIAPSNMTLATHASLFTGLAASVHRAHYDAGRPAGRPLAAGVPTLAEIFAARGYDVSSVAGNYGFLGAGFGLDRGFQWVDARPRRSTLGVIPAASVRGAARRLLRGALHVGPETETRARGADEITDLALERIDRAQSLGRPYFLFVNYFDAHERALVPAPFASVSSRGTGALFATRLSEMNATGRVALAAREREDLVARYDETLAALDASLARLLSRVSASSGPADTLVVVTSDHGEAWGEHETLGHGSTLYQEQVHVPLVVHAPGQSSPRVVETEFGLASVFGLLTGAAPAGDSVVSESFPLVRTPEKPGVRGGRALFEGGRVLVRGIDGRLELYAPWSDPGETHDLAGDPAEADARARLSAHLDAWIAAHPPRRDPESADEREARARLRALGYLP